jgi:formylglycine-generating enzyme
MVDRLEPIGFWSYSTIDDRSSSGHLSRLRVRLRNALQLNVGRQEVIIFQDVAAIPHGTEWEQEIQKALDKSSFMIPIVTPGFLQSNWCCKEVLRFREREQQLGRADLIFPFIYIRTDDVDPDREDECYSKEVFHLLRSRQRFDFWDLRYHDVESPDVHRRIGTLADSLNAALRRRVNAAVPPPKPAKPETLAAAPEPVPPPGSGPAPFAVTRDIPDGPELVLIPKGTFTMGVPSQEEEREGVPKQFRGWSAPRRAVNIAEPFWLGRYPVTRGQFAAFVADKGYKTADEALTYEPDDKGKWEYKLRKPRDWRNAGFPQTDHDPVVCVSHEDATEYVKWLQDITGKPYRLPSEAEWEYAARAGTTTARFWGDGRSDAARYAKIADRALMARMNRSFDAERFFDSDSGYPFTAPAGTFLPNPFGLYDMLGNVWEWTADCWNEDLNGQPTDGSARTTGDCSRRVVRGGSWGSDPRGVRAGDRDWYSTGDRNDYTGIRVARTHFNP